MALVNPSPGAGERTDAPCFAAGDLVAVLLPLPLAGAYDYRVPDGVTVAVGGFVHVPLGRRQEIGVICGGWLIGWRLIRCRLRGRCCGW
jgi:primosomal protein N' (replication factor Y)